MIDWARYYLGLKFPIIPLGRGSKCPVVRGWTESTHRADEFRNRNIGVRAGELVTVGEKEGYLLIVDFDSQIYLYLSNCVLRYLCLGRPAFVQVASITAIIYST